MIYNRLVIVGAGEFGRMAFHYFSEYTDYELVGFAVESAYRNESTLEELPIIDFEEIQNIFPPESTEVFVAISSTSLNQIRTRLFDTCKKMGYHCASFIHPHSIIGFDTVIGENVFIFEHVSIQYHCKIGDNCVIWEGSAISHSSKIDNNCWIAPGVTLAGFCHIGKNCFLGVGSVYKDGIHISNHTMIGAGAVIVKDIEKSGETYVGNPGKSKVH